MTTVRKVLVESRDAPIAQTTLYTATNVTATIDAAVATNTTAGALTLSVNLVPPSGSVLAANRLVSAVSIAAGASYMLPELRLQDLANGGSISAIASGAGIAFRVSGRESTSG